MTAALVVRGDAADLLPGLPDSAVDAVVTDPPWNLGREYGQHGDRLTEDGYVEWLRPILAECGRISRGPVVACIGTHHRELLPRLLAGTCLRAAAWLYWHREPGSQEAVVVAAPPGWPLSDNRLLAARRVLARTPEVRRRRGHPVPKPVPVMAALVRLACPPGGVVLDPFVGTGSTLVAARGAGRRSIGVELEERFCRTAAHRLAGPTGPRHGHAGAWQPAGRGTRPCP